MRIALVDIGSNSTKCCVYEIEKREIKPLFFETAYNRIGEKLAENKKIENQKIFELINVLNSFKKEIEKYDSQETICLATWALRYAENAKTVVKEVEDNAGLKINILNEYDENLYTFYTLYFFKIFQAHKTALNIGGGSIEISTGSQSLENTITLQPGLVTLKEKFFDDPYIVNFAKVKRATDYIWKILKQQNIKSQVVPNTPIIGIGGTFSALFDIFLKKLKKDVEIIEPKLIKIATTSFTLLFNKVINWQPQNFEKQFGLHPKRADIFLPALVVIKSLSDVLEFTDIYISTLSMREGYIYYHYLK
ncbi:MAG: Ppx/GppA phosphatase family protein [Planctomycetota bacterium]